VLEDIKTYALGVLLLVCAALGTAAWLSHEHAGIATEQRDTARGERDRLTSAVGAQKKEAGEKLAALNTTMLAHQRQLDDARAAQEKNDAQNTQTVAGLRTDLRRIRAAANGLLTAAAGAGRGDGGGGTPGQDPASADPGAAGAAQAERLVPKTAAEQGDDEAFVADTINDAYASCRADAFSIRRPVK
jgi:hypothetical protein